MLFFLFMLVLLASSTETKVRVKVISIRKCNLPESLWDPAHPVTSNATVRQISRNVTVMDVCFTSQKYGPVSFSFKSFKMLPNGNKHLVLKLEKVNCNNNLISKLAILLKAAIDKNCVVEAGSVQVKDLDINGLRFLMTKSLTGVGKYSFEIVFLSPYGIVDCYYIVNELVEIKY